jgi:hypothetical protein
MVDLLPNRLELTAGGKLDPRALPAHGGVYLITDEGARPVLLASGQNLRRVVVNRLAPPPAGEKSKRTDLSQVARCVHWREAFSRFESAWIHWRVARAMYPRAYRDLIAFSPAWFLRVEPSSSSPVFRTVREFPADSARYFGPFAIRKNAEEWRRMLEDIFDLCRYPDILEQAPNGQPCSYHEMGQCAAPCNNTISMDVYRESVTAAAAFCGGDREPRLHVLRDRMQRASEALEFERAGAIRRMMDRAVALSGKAEYRHVGELSSCSWLIVMRAGPKRRTEKGTLVRPFYARMGVIEAGEPIALSDIKSAAEEWLSGCERDPVPPPASRSEQRERCEALWLTAKFLFQAERSGGLFYRFDRLPHADDLAQQVREAFGPRQGKQD